MKLKRSTTVLGLAAAASLTLSACGGGDEETTTPDTGSDTSQEMTDEPMDDMDDMDSETPMDDMDDMDDMDMSTDAMGGGQTGEEFGAACSAVPAEGDGSFEGMATAPVATAADANPELEELVGAVNEAGLAQTLNDLPEATVFAPINSAFEALDPATADAAMADPEGLLSAVLTYHVLPERLAPDELAGEHVTANPDGATLEVEGSGEEFTVNGEAMVVCGNVQTANATVYLIDQVLLPPM